ncbi:unnamed protein product [Ectocarpus sp. 12 AP-2014]
MTAPPATRTGLGVLRDGHEERKRKLTTCRAERLKHESSRICLNVGRLNRLIRLTDSASLPDSTQIKVDLGQQCAVGSQPEQTDMLPMRSSKLERFPRILL